MNALIFHARAYSFTGKDGRLVTGNSVSYLEDMEPATGPDESGLAPMTLRATDEAIAELTRAKLPAIFSVRIGRRAGRDGKPDSFITEAKLVRPVPVESLLGPSK